MSAFSIVSFLFTFGEVSYIRLQGSETLCETFNSRVSTIPKRVKFVLTASRICTNLCKG